MPVFLFSVSVLCGIFLIGYIAWVVMKRLQKDPKAKIEKIHEENRNKILDFVYNEVSKKREQTSAASTLKILILEKLNLSPSQLVSYLKELNRTKLVIESDESVALTSFGVRYYEIFIKDKMNKLKNCK